MYIIPIQYVLTVYHMKYKNMFYNNIFNDPKEFCYRLENNINI